MTKTHWSLMQKINTKQSHQLMAAGIEFHSVGSGAFAQITTTNGKQVTLLRLMFPEYLYVIGYDFDIY